MVANSNHALAQPNHQGSCTLAEELGKSGRVVKIWKNKWLPTPTTCSRCWMQWKCFYEECTTIKSQPNKTFFRPGDKCSVRFSSPYLWFGSWDSWTCFIELSFHSGCLGRVTLHVMEEMLNRCENEEYKLIAVILVRKFWFIRNTYNIQYMGPEILLVQTKLSERL